MMPSSNLSPEQQVVDALHEYTQICAGADTCAAREVLEPLLAERDRLREAFAAYVAATLFSIGQLRLEGHQQADSLYAAIKEARGALDAIV